MDFRAWCPCPTPKPTRWCWRAAVQQQPGLGLAGWLSGLEPVRLEVSGRQLVLEAGMEDRWLVSDLADDEAGSARQAFEQARQEAGGLQFLAVQSRPESSEFAGFWLLRDLPDV